jgi:hypothetical protein
VVVCEHDTRPADHPSMIEGALLPPLCGIGTTVGAG